MFLSANSLRNSYNAPAHPYATLPAIALVYLDCIAAIIDLENFVESMYLVKQQIEFCNHTEQGNKQFGL